MLFLKNKPCTRTVHGKQNIFFFFALTAFFIFFPLQKTEALFCGDGILDTGEACDDLLFANITKISVGAYHSCAIDAGGQVYCWGDNTYGQLGNGTDTQSNTPILVTGLPAVAGISAGGQHTCAYTTDGQVYCWGDDAYGQLGNGDGTNAQKNTPTSLSGLLPTIIEITSGENSACAVSVSGEVYCWGQNTYGQLGDGTNLSREFPALVTGLPTINGASAGTSHSCAYTAGGQVYCWGDNTYGQLGNGTDTPSNTPILVTGLPAVAGISAGGQHTCAYTTDGQVYCWGDDTYGQMGNDDDGINAQINMPILVIGLTGVLKIDLGIFHSCVHTISDENYCWGYNSNGQLGNGNTTQSNAPTLVTVLTNIAEISTGAFHSCAYKISGEVYCWGYNLKGQLGDNTVITKSTAVQAKPLTATQSCTASVGANTYPGAQTCRTDCTFNACSTSMYCGDNATNGNTEQCDLNLTATACVPPYNGSCNWCSLTCQNNTVIGPKCTDGIKNGAEICDGNDLGGQTCSSQGFVSGSLACNSTCNSFITTLCVSQICGNGAREGTETCDDGNTVTESCVYGQTSCIVCNNACQNVAGATSYCGDISVNGSENCDDGNTVTETCSYGQTSCAVCNNICRSESGATSYCGDNNRNNASEQCDLNNSPTPNCTAPYEGSCNWCDMSCRNNTLLGPGCGDGILTAPETCDQGGGNKTNGDGCNNICAEESGWNCTGVGANSCIPICGDGLKVGIEACDDGNTGSDDGCASDCSAIDPGYYCSVPGSVCTTLCGDGTSAGAENCDDGNTITEACAYGVRGCSVCDSVCDLVDGDVAYCGDHIVNGSEECDYDTKSELPNPHGGDGCSSTCAVEDGFSCFQNTLNQNTCVFHCGNGIPEETALFTERCDYGTVGKVERSTDPDGRGLYNGEPCTDIGYNRDCTMCNLSCNTEYIQGPFCGDGRWDQGNEGCDDGNLNSGDGCSNCNVDNGWFCSSVIGVGSSCITRCGFDGCANNAAESCTTCPQDCGLCPIGQRPSVAQAHEEDLFVNFVEKLKATFIRPTFLIDIPGLKIEDPTANAPVFAPPAESTLDIGVPTTIIIGNQNYTFTVNSSDSNSGIINFSIR